jgi:hypothetical protein
MKAWIGAPLVMLVAVAPVAAHDEAKTKIDPSVILDLTAPRAPDPSRAYDEAIKREGPASPQTQWKQRPDGGYQYGNTTIFIRHDCPPGSEFYEPPPLPGRRR